MWEWIDLYFRRGSTEHWYWGFMGSVSWRYWIFALFCPTHFPIQAATWIPYIIEHLKRSGNLTSKAANRTTFEWGSADMAFLVYMSPCTKNINILVKNESIELQRLFVQVLGKLCIQDPLVSWEIPSSQVSFIHEQIEFMEIAISILGSQNSLSTPSSWKTFRGNLMCKN